MRLVRTVVAISYPVLVYAGLKSGGPRLVALAVGIGLAAHAALTLPRRRSLLKAVSIPALGLGAVLALVIVFNQGQFFLFVPALTNAALLMGFAKTLWRGPSMAESFARLRGRDLPPEEVLYCRANTLMWCVVFALNGSVSLWLALHGSLEWWTLYTGGLSYLFVIAIFAVELVYRYWRFRPYDGSPTDPLFRWIFPPRAPV
jgi:uncharacterized membrane protein